jgi:hypothetical protein
MRVMHAAACNPNPRLALALPLKSIGVEALLAVLRFVMDRGVRIGALAPSATLVDDWGCNTNTQAGPTTMLGPLHTSLFSHLTDLGT